MASAHDKLVAEVVKTVESLGIVSCDLSGGVAFCLPRAAELVLSALVPTRAVFAKFGAMSPSDLTWKVPDVVVTHEERRVVLDVCGWRESTVRAARKVENMIASSAEAQIVGLVLVHEPRRRNGFTKSAARDAELDRAMQHLKSSLERLCDRSVDVESPLEALQAVWDALARDRIGTVNWSAIRELEASGPSWREELKNATSKLLQAEIPLLTK